MMNMGPITKLISKIPGTPAHQDVMRRKEFEEQIRVKEEQKEADETRKSVTRTIARQEAAIQEQGKRAGAAYGRGDKAGADFYTAAIAKTKAQLRESENRLRRIEGAEGKVISSQDEIKTRQVEERAKKRIINLVEGVNPTQTSSIEADYALAERYLSATTPVAQADEGEASEEDLAFAKSIVEAEIALQASEQQQRLDRMVQNIDRLDTATNSYARSQH
jgi:hypothetical protein